MANVYVWYWQYSLAFPLSLMIVLCCFYCCRILCLRSVEANDRTRNRQARRNQQRPTQQSQVYSISTVVVSDPLPPYTQKRPDLVGDLPPSYDEAIVLAKELSLKTAQQNPASST